MPTISILGSGGWGTAIAVILAGKPGTAIRLWSARAETARDLQATRENRRQLPGVTIPDAVAITHDPDEAVRDADLWVTAIPTAYLKATLAPFVPLCPRHVKIVSLTKGIEVGSFQRPSDMLRGLFPEPSVAVLSGPSHAEEVARRMPTSVVIASNDGHLAVQCQDLFSTDRFRVYTNSDLVGVELAGALKNIYGIAAGLCDGLGFGDNAKAALLTRSLVEMTRYAVAHGAEPQTLSGLAGMGDLIATCFSRHGRNRRVGERIAAGETLAAVTAGPQVAEGVLTTRSVVDRSRVMGLEMPIAAGVAAVLFDGVKPIELVQGLLNREPKREGW